MPKKIIHTEIECPYIERLISMEADIRYIAEALKGNGHEGLIQECETNTRWIEQAKGSITTMQWLIGSGLLINFFMLGVIILKQYVGI